MLHSEDGVLFTIGLVDPLSKHSAYGCEHEALFCVPEAVRCVKVLLGIL